ncbi:MAG: hypothetical protein AB8E87_11880, partial [Prochlorococcus sp.]
VAKKPPAQTPWQHRWKGLERQLLENWTGLLGVLAIVAGLSFVAISAALSMQAFQRFLLLVALCIVMAIPAALLPASHRLKRLADWLVSGSAALLLFAAAAASAWPALGLQWIHAPLPGLALVVLAVAINLRLAITSTTPWLAASHVVISMLPLPIAAPSMQASLLTGVIASIGLLSPAARMGASRLVISLCFLISQLWISQASGSVAPAAVTVVICAAVIAQLQWRPGAHQQEKLVWLRTELATAWAGLLLVVCNSPLEFGIRSLVLAVAAVAAAGLCFDRRGPQSVQIAQVHWIAALALALTASLVVVAELDTTTILLVALVLLIAVFLFDAARARDRLRVRVAGYALLLMDSILLVQLLSEADRLSLAALPFVISAGVVNQLLVMPVKAVPNVGVIPAVEAVFGSLLPVVGVLVLVDPIGAQRWCVLAVCILSLLLSRWPKSHQTLRWPALTLSCLVWIGLSLDPPNLSLVGLNLPQLGEQILPMAGIAMAMVITSPRLESSFWRGRSFGLILSALTLFSLAGFVKRALPIEFVPFASLGWLLVAVLLIAVSCRFSVLNQRRESIVLLAMAYLAMTVFGVQRLGAVNISDGVATGQLIVDGLAIAAMVVWRLLGDRLPLHGLSLWDGPRTYSAELALLGLLFSWIQWLPNWSLVIALGSFSTIAWCVPVRRDWPRVREQGLIAFWIGLVALLGLSPESLPEFSLAVLTLVVACSRMQPELIRIAASRDLSG